MTRNVLRGSTLLLLLIFSAFPGAAYAADLSFDPATATSPVGEEFSVKVVIDPAGASVNAADGTVTFDKDVLSVASVSKEGSAFSLWTSDPTFSNSAGTVTFSGGSPSAFAKLSPILTIKFKGKTVGTAKASFSKGSILAADGKGTDVFAKGGEATFTISEAAAAAEPTAEDAPGPVPLAPEITSSSYGKPDQWYATSTGVFSWKLQPDVVSVRIIMSDAETATPNQVLKGLATSTTVTGIKDGISYIFVQYKNDSGWGEIGKRKFQIDTVPPTEFDIALLDPESKTAAPKLSFKAEDALSGIDRYDILIAGNVAASPRAQEVVDGAFPIPPQEGGPVAVTIKAYDKAGNVREVTRQLTLPKVDKPAPKAAEGEAPPPSSGWTIERILAILFAFIIGALATMNYNLKKNAQEEKSRLLKRVSEIGDKNDRVFGAMREEFEVMVNNLDAKPQLTPAERDFLENVKEVIDISEELLDSGFEELKKQVRGQ